MLDSDFPGDALKERLRRLSGGQKILAALHRARNALTNPLRAEPPPWLDPDHNIMVLWSAKSACTTSFVWFASCAGFIDDLRESGKHPHRYRREDYMHSDLYRAGLVRMVDDYRVIHVIRDPYQRAVSSYRHMLKHASDRHRSGLRGGHGDGSSGFSFSQFLDYLETLDLTSTNVHVKAQRHAVERIKAPDFIINISKQDLLCELARLERELGLPATDLEALEPAIERQSRRKAKTIPFAKADDVGKIAFSKQAAKGNSPFPDYEQFLSPDNKRRIERLYEADFDFFQPYL
jgi:hypothetical protein